MSNPPVAQFDPSAAYAPAAFDPSADYAPATTTPASTPGAFQTKPEGKIYNAETLGSEPLTPVPGTSPATAAKARAAMPSFPQQVQQSQREEAGMLPDIGAAIGASMGPAGAGSGAAIGTALEPTLGKEINDSDIVKNAATAAISQKAFEMLPDGAQKVWHFFAGDNSEASLWRAGNAALGVKPSQIKMAPGTGDIADAFNIPYRSVFNETGLTPTELSKMTPFEQAAAIKPHLDAAGKRIDAIADQATQNGVKVDIGSSIQDAIDNIDDPGIRMRAMGIYSKTVKGLQMQSITAATPNDAVALRRALWDGLPSRYRGPLYGAVTGDLKAAVPDLAPADTTYSELRAATDATKAKAQKMAVTAPQAPGMTLLKKAAPYAIGASGVAAPALAYESLKALLGGGDH